MTVILFGVLTLGVVVLLHELGHFLMARACRVPVERFSIGIGPKVWGFRRGDVEYWIAALPLGGYVKMAGEEVVDDTPPSPDTFLGHPWWHRVLIALAGPGANFITALVVIIGIYLTGVHYADAPSVVGRMSAASPVATAGLQLNDRIVRVDGQATASAWEVRTALLGGRKAPRREHPVDVLLTVERAGQPFEVTIPAASLAAFSDSLDFRLLPVVQMVMPGNPAYVAGMKAGDRILTVEGEPIEEWGDLLNRISARPGQVTRLTVDRAGTTLDLTLTPIGVRLDRKTVGRIGISPAGSLHVESYPPGQALAYGWQEAVGRVGATFKGLFDLARHPKSFKDSISGPLAIMQMSGEAATRGWYEIFQNLVFLSIALMVFNLLPIPILDGGLVMMALAEAIRRRPVPVKVQLALQQVGLVLLGSLIIFAMLNDPWKMFQRRRALSKLEQTKSAPVDTPRGAGDGTGH